MEQKKTLWIVAAAGIFLLVVVGAALILYSPSLHQSAPIQAGFDPASGWISSTKQSATPVPEGGFAFNTETPAASESTTSTLPPSPFASSENTSGDAQSKLTQDTNNPIHTDKLTVISDNTTLVSTGTTTIDLNSLKSSGTTSNIVAKNEMTASQINTNRAQESLPPRPAHAQPATPERAPETYYTPAPVAKASTPAPKSAPVASKKTTTTSAAKTTVAAKTTTKAATATKVASSAKKAPDAFWVQAAAYTSKRNADEARSTLESNKIASEVFTFTDSNGKTFYRVRVGPYVTKSEAEYWQSRIALIDKFASSKSVIVNTAVN
ncbi:MAG: SPOR domain-containing protein [Treponema sp.]|nr:SPOR domain-containing protein [Treponema sp.]